MPLATLDPSPISKFYRHMRSQTGTHLQVMLARALPLVVALLPLCAAEDDPVRRTIVDVNGQQAIVDSSAHYELFDHEDKPLFGHAGHDAGKARCRKPLASRSWSMCGTLLCQWTSRAASALSSDGSFFVSTGQCRWPIC